MKHLKKFGSRLSWLLALPLAGCLAGGSASAADDAAKLKKAEAGEKHKVEKRIKVMVAGEADEACCGDGQIVLKVIDEDGHRKVIKKRIGGGKRGFLGVHLVGLTPELKKHYTGDPKIGVLIAKLEPDSPALKAGMQVGDVMVSVDGQPVDSALKIGELIGGHKQGDKVKIGVVRNGKKTELVATLTVQERTFKRIGKKMIWMGDEGQIDFDFDFGELGEAIGEEIEVEVMEKLKDPALMKKIQFLKQKEAMQEKMEEKLLKMEERLKQLEEKLQGKLDRMLGPPDKIEKTT